MSSPSSSTSPSIRAPGMTSWRRLRVRMNVDLPQPDGPISAVTCWGSMARVTSSTALNPPYQALTWLASTRFTGGQARSGAGARLRAYASRSDLRGERSRHHVVDPLADVDRVVGDALEVPAQQRDR